MVRHGHRAAYAILALLTVATPAFARVVISEVMWMGSDQSTADEWVEVVGVNDGATSFPLSLSGWTLRVQSGTGENVIARLGEGVTVQSGQYLVVSNYPALTSRLAVEPALTTTSMILPNTKFLLRLYDAAGLLIDAVDDGVGIPFAGSNPSGGGPKASMERISLSGAGNVKENWQTAIATVGFDPGVPIFGTPGSPRTLTGASTSSSFPSSVSFSSSSISSSGSSSSFSSLSSFLSFSSSSCSPTAHDVRIAIQSGDTHGEGKVTVNLQILWEGKGSLRCTWDYGDGFLSTSCNPPSHTFTVPGRYEVRLEAEDACGGSGVQTLPIEVIAVAKTGGPWRTGSQSSAHILRQARVIRVIDGDTVEVMEEGGKMEIIRLLGIDAPERGREHPFEGWGDAAREALRGLLDGAVTELTFDEERKDAYGRTLAYLAIRGHDVGAELLRQGLAEVYRKCRCWRKEEYFRLEDEARRMRVGMWGAVEGTEGEKGTEVTKGTKVTEVLQKKGSSSSTFVPSVSSMPFVPSLSADKRVEIFLSEIYPVPLPAEEEWVELWNGGGEPVDLSGWQLDDVRGGGSQGWEFPEGFIVQPGTFIVLRSDQTRLAFNNEGDDVQLLVPDGLVIDRVTYGKLRHGESFARVIQRIGGSGKFRATERFCITHHPTPFERNICEERNRSVVTSRLPRAARLARRVRYRNIFPKGMESGRVAVPDDPLLAAIIEQAKRSQSGGQMVWEQEVVPPGKGKTVEWEVMLLPFLLVVGAHGILTGIRRSSIL